MFLSYLSPSLRPTQAARLLVTSSETISTNSNYVVPDDEPEKRMLKKIKAKKKKSKNSKSLSPVKKPSKRPSVKPSKKPSGCDANCVGNENALVSKWLSGNAVYLCSNGKVDVYKTTYTVDNPNNLPCNRIKIIIKYCGGLSTRCGLNWYDGSEDNSFGIRFLPTPAATGNTVLDITLDGVTLASHTSKITLGFFALPAESENCKNSVGGTYQLDGKVAQAYYVGI